MTNLILKRGKLTRSSGQWQDEDYDVLADGKVVGRIYEDASASTPPETSPSLLRASRRCRSSRPASPVRSR